MRISNIQICQNFKSNQEKQQISKQKPEFIDKLLSAVSDPRDINDCVAVPRGIFKAYLFIMAGFSLLGISNIIPQKFGKTKAALTVAGNILNFMSALYFAKPFAFKELSPTVNKNEYNA